MVMLNTTLPRRLPSAAAALSPPATPFLLRLDRLTVIPRAMANSFWADNPVTLYTSPLMRAIMSRCCRGGTVAGHCSNFGELSTSINHNCALSTGQLVVRSLSSKRGNRGTHALARKNHH